MDATVKEAMKSKPDSILVMSIAGISTPVIKALRTANFPSPIYSWSVSATNDAFTTLGDSARGVAFSVVMPNPSLRKDELTKGFRAFADQSGIGTSFRAIEVYVTGMVLVAALNRINGKVAGKDVWRALEESTSVDLGGYVVGFSPTNRNGSKYVNIVILGKNGRFVE